MDDIERLKIESKRLDALVEEMNPGDKIRGAAAIRDELLRQGKTLSPKDEKVLTAFSRDEVDFAALTQQCLGRI